MIAKFSPNGADVGLDKREYAFLHLTLSYVLDGIKLSDHDFVNILGMSRDKAEAFRDSLVAAESSARARGNHWNPSKPTMT